MKTRNFITSMAIMMALGTGTLFASNHSHNDKSVSSHRRGGERQEMVVSHAGRHHNSTHLNAASYDSKRYDIRGYEDRVRHENGHWSYLRDGRWYHYDHFIAPRTYYSRSLSYWGTGIVLGALIGSVISALAN